MGLSRVGVRAPAKPTITPPSVPAKAQVNHSIEYSSGTIITSSDLTRWLRRSRTIDSRALDSRAR